MLLTGTRENRTTGLAHRLKCGWTVLGIDVDRCAAVLADVCAVAGYAAYMYAVAGEAELLIGSGADGGIECRWQGSQTGEDVIEYSGEVGGEGDHDAWYEVCRRRDPRRGGNKKSGYQANA